MSIDSSLLDRVRLRLAQEGAPPTPARVAAAVRQEGGPVRGDDDVLAMARELRSELVGAGPLEPLLRDPAVSDVLVNAPDEVWVDRGAGLLRAPVRFRDDAAVRRLAQRLVVGVGRRLDDAQPWVDARLPDGTRMHAVLPPLSPTTLLSLRVLRSTPFRLDELVTAGSLPPAAVEVLHAVVRARLAFLVTGGTGTGKTTLLAALLSVVDPAERVVLVEDAAELRPDCPHLVRLEGRPPNVEGAGAVVLRDLVRQALRMRPDRLVVGEVRGGEVTELLAALNTGHDGGCGTLHANGAAEVPARLEALGVAAGLGRDALHSQLAAALQVVVHLDRATSGQRRLAEIRVLGRGPDGLVVAEPALLARAGALVAADVGAARLATVLTERGVPAPTALR